MVERQEQLREAQARFKARQKQSHAHLDLFISMPAKNKLEETAKALQMSQREYLEYLLLHSKPSNLSDEELEAATQQEREGLLKTQIGQEIISLIDPDPKIYAKLSFNDILQLVKKQAYWLNRLEKVNEVLIRRAAQFDKK